MPFESNAQRRYLYEVHPEIAKKFASMTPENAKLPEKIGHQSAATTRKETRYESMKRLM